MRNNQDGFVLLTTIMVLALLTMMGFAGIQLTCIDLKIAGNYRQMKAAFYNAEAGIEIGQSLAKAIHEHQEINNNDYINNPGAWKVTFNDNGQFIDNHGNVLSIGFSSSPMEFTGTITLHVDPGTGDVRCFGDHDDNPVTPAYMFWATPADRSKGRPYLRICSIGYYPNKMNLSSSRQIIEIEVQPIVEFQLPEAALYVNGTFVSHGTPQSLLGEGDPSRWTPCNGMDIIGTNPSVNDFTGNYNICGLLPCDANQPDIIDDAPPYPVDALIESLKPYAETITGSDYAFSPNPSGSDKIYYYNGDITINNLTGYGTIIIQGSLTVGGGIGWNGMIIVSDNLTMNGGGNNQIHGSLIVGGDVTGNGNPDVYYDCDLVLQLQERHKKYVRTYWKQIFFKSTII